MMRTCVLAGLLGLACKAASAGPCFPTSYSTIPPQTVIANPSVQAGCPLPVPLFGGAATATGVTANGALGVLPVNAKLRAIYVANTTGNAVTGGVNIGTTAGGSDVVAGAAVGGSALVTISGAAMLKSWISTASQTQLYVSAGTTWNSANLTIELVWDQ